MVNFHYQAVLGESMLCISTVTLRPRHGVRSSNGDIIHSERRFIQWNFKGFDLRDLPHDNLVGGL